ncbi:formate dehydrogenase accessory sulfurtransferase FdhD [Magnetospirillum sp. SS-4]|uniref:formate dehydrogenase accessory sulfurtransferase FdhD n=1 Tax=Magnetospirillum sp. SS-4 TaxID=2681465 RepID=UPI00137E98DB|nr:formate dehydrogenase accessory sulfurtransferase FdhD [Magnetospirillum sp. SS-4]CAA7626268.1 Protein FdhD homolog [Magnetospirillum sp. SS-4]
MTVMSASPAATGHPSMEAVAVDRWRDGRTETAMDMAAAEVPVSLEYNGISHAVMLASPSDLEDFAIGFSLTEGIVDHPGDILDLEVDERCEGFAVRLTIASARFHRLKQHRRTLAGRTGCGLCGAESLSQVFRDIAPVAATARMKPSALQGAFMDLAANQPLQRLTGATHAAAWAEPDGTVVLIREDVGRHNALDKLVGAMALAGIDAAAGAAMVTSRASYEMVQKAAATGIGILAAISAPTVLAIRMAEALNLTLVGFARRDHHVLYAGRQRIGESDPSEGVAP